MSVVSSHLLFKLLRGGNSITCILLYFINYALLSLPEGVNISMQQQSFFGGEEDGNIPVCAMIVFGAIEREVSVILSPMDSGDAECKRVAVVFMYVNKVSDILIVLCSWE